ncbi:MAG: hypothetical protein FWB77_02995 [Treponema sp.]|nr:hypothetical protein [Treponema sp.]
MIAIDSGSAQAKSAAFALATGWENYMNSTDKMSSCLSEMRKAAIDIICQTGYTDDSVYDSLEKSYINNFLSDEPDFEEIKKTLKALAVINTDRSVNLLFIFLQGLHQKKHKGIWTIKEQRIFPWVVTAVALSKIKSRNIWNLLMVIFRTDIYSNSERLYAKNALIKIKAANKHPAA